MNRSRDVPAGEQSQTLERVLPVQMIDEFVQVLNQRSNLSFLEFAVEPLQSLRHEILDDDPVSLVRGCRSMSGSQHGNRWVIPVALEELQLGATDHA